MKRLFAMALGVAAIFTTSCDDEPYVEQYNDFRQSEAYSFMPMQEGSYWVYDVEYINEDGTPYTGDDYENSTDSVYISANAYFEGREGFRAENHNLSNGDVEEVTYAFVGNSLYIFATPLTGNGQQYGPSGWTEVFDLDNTSKSIVDQSFKIEDENTPEAYMDVAYSYIYEITGNSKEEIIDGEGEWDIMSISYTNNMKTKTVVPMMPDTEVEKSSTDIRKLAKNVGPVYSETSTSTAGFLSDTPSESPIRVQKLVRYKL
jgi:hypothetical protein